MPPVLRALFLRRRSEGLLLERWQERSALQALYGHRGGTVVAAPIHAPVMYSDGSSDGLCGSLDVFADLAALPLSDDE